MALDLHSWIIDVVWRLENDGQLEDSRVELKSDWPIDTAKTARRLAGHANAARGEPILWVVGLDANRGVVGATGAETSDWLSRIAGCFAGPCPQLLQDRAITVRDGCVVGLAFDTTEAPYVVMNPVYGQPKGGSIEREVPWREGTSIRSATRNDLLGLLKPQSLLPHLRVEWALLQYESISLDFNVAFYLTPSTPDLLVLPWHEATVHVRIPGRSRIPLQIHYLGQNQESRTITHTRSEALIYGPGQMLLGARAIDLDLRKAPPTSVVAEVIVAPAGYAKVLAVEAVLTSVSYARLELQKAHVAAQWRTA